MELVAPAAQTAAVHHPWRSIREQLPGWRVVFTPLPDGVFGDTNAQDRCIRVDSALTQVQRRCTIEHERIHARDGDVGPQPEWREAEVNAEAARNLIPLSMLVEACKWSLEREELAADLWVDLDTLQWRLDNLTDDERMDVRQALAERDFHLEGADDGASQD